MELAQEDRTNEDTNQNEYSMRASYLDKMIAIVVFEANPVHIGKASCVVLEWMRQPALLRLEGCLGCQRKMRGIETQGPCKTKLLYGKRAAQLVYVVGIFPVQPDCSTCTTRGGVVYVSV